MIYNTLIWGCGQVYNDIFNAIKLQEIKGEIKVIGITGNQEIYQEIDGYPFYSRYDLLDKKIDLIIVASNDYSSICADALLYTSLSEDRIIPGKVLKIPEINIEKYLRLVESRISIIANNCWGGVTYHSLGLKFNSPFINMFLDDENYLRLLRDFDKYINCDLSFKRMNYEENLKRNYPVCDLNGEVELHFNHYTSFEEAYQKWNARLKRLNKNNLFIMMYTEDIQKAEIFDQLQFAKKVCFVPLGRKRYCMKSVLEVDVEKYGNSKMRFFEILNNIAIGKYLDYDIFELLDGNINHRRISKVNSNDQQ